MNQAAVKLTQYSHGAGCGCKISPSVLASILQKSPYIFNDPKILVGNETNDDAAVYDLGNGTGIISTTDFFMPIVDDPFDFGRIAATNAISDIYAMGGQPIMAIAILGWPIQQLAPEIAANVVNGARQVCQQARISLAGGHSIDAPEPIFGLAVTGKIAITHIKKNSSAHPGDKLYLSKPLGIGILTTAEKRGELLAEHQNLATQTMCQLNHAGHQFATLNDVHAMTDVTGFGLLGHLLELCRGANLHATLNYSQIPTLAGVDYYLKQGCVPGGSERNFASYGQHISQISKKQQQLLCDPQTSGGLLIAVAPHAVTELQKLANQCQCHLTEIGQLHKPIKGKATITIMD